MWWNIFWHAHTGCLARCSIFCALFSQRVKNRNWYVRKRQWQKARGKPHTRTHTRAHTRTPFSLQHFLSLFLSFLSLICCVFFPFLFSAARISAGFPEQTVCVAERELKWKWVSWRQGVGVMDSNDRPNKDNYQNLLLLGAIAAASAFVVTILIVLLCVGCQR